MPSKRATRANTGRGSAGSPDRDQPFVFGPKDAALTDQLAVLGMGWKASPNRFLKAGRQWIQKWRFQPLSEIAHAFLLLEKTAARFSLMNDQRGAFIAHVRIAGRAGRAAGRSLPRVISIAVAQALGVKVES
jgi:hypothetical protein